MSHVINAIPLLDQNKTVIDFNGYGTTVYRFNGKFEVVVDANTKRIVLNEKLETVEFQINESAVTGYGEKLLTKEQFDAALLEIKRTSPDPIMLKWSLEKFRSENPAKMVNVPTWRTYSNVTIFEPQNIETGNDFIKSYLHVGNGIGKETGNLYVYERGNALAHIARECLIELGLTASGDSYCSGEKFFFSNINSVGTLRAFGTFHFTDMKSTSNTVSGTLESLSKRFQDDSKMIKDHLKLEYLKKFGHSEIDVLTVAKLITSLESLRATIRGVESMAKTRGKHNQSIHMIDEIKTNLVNSIKI